MNINQDKLSILQKQFEGAANQFPEMVYYTAMLSVEDYKNHGHLTRNACFYEADNVSEVMKKKLDPWRIDFFGKEIHAWDDGRYDSPVIRDGPSNHYHWLVRPIGQIWDTLPAMQRIHTLTQQASIILKQLYGIIGGLNRTTHAQSNYLSHWFRAMLEILIDEKHESSFILEELSYLNKEFFVAEKTQNVELIQKLLSERPPTFDGISDVFLKSALVCTILIDRLRKNDADKPKVTEDDELIKAGAAKELVSAASGALELISNTDDLNSTLRSEQVQNLEAKIIVLGHECGLLEEYQRVGLNADSYYREQYAYDTCIFPEELGEFEWSVPKELRVLCEKAKMLINKAPEETGQKSKPAEEPSKEAKNVFKKDGDFWQVAYQSNDTTTIKDSKGMSYIARLLEKPNEPIAALSLANPKSDTKLMIQGKAVENDTVSSDSGKPQEIIDEDTLQSCQKRIIDINNELADAEKNNDLAAQERLEAEKEQILSELNAVRNLKGESRSFTDNLVKARKAVTNAIKRALENIKTHSMPLYQHLPR